MAPKTLRTLARALSLAARALADDAQLRRALEQKPRRQITITPKRRAALKLQGAYIGHMRMLPPAQKARVRKEREARGFHAAIRLARRLGRAT